MAKVITRYFEDAGQARAVQSTLVREKGFPPRIVRLFDESKGLSKALKAAEVDDATAKAYADKVKTGGAVVLVRAGYQPLGVARIARQTLADMGAADMGDLVEEVTVKDTAKVSNSILTNHPLLMTTPRDPDSGNVFFAEWPIGHISRRKPFMTQLDRPHMHWANWPIPLISRRKPYTGSIIPRHAHMANFPIPLISRRKPYDKMVIPRHGRMANWPIPLISRRKPYTGSIFPRHQRMANVPFPLLINGKQGTNAIIPGHPHMANFPIPLISKRKPYDEMVIPRHGRMANWPIPLISRRKPYDKMAISRHGRMADFPIPLIIRKDAKPEDSRTKGFSISRMLGIPTVIRR